MVGWAFGAAALALVVALAATGPQAAEGLAEPLDGRVNEYAKCDDANDPANIDDLIVVNSTINADNSMDVILRTHNEESGGIGGAAGIVYFEVRGDQTSVLRVYDFERIPQLGGNNNDYKFRIPDITEISNHPRSSADLQPGDVREDRYSDKKANDFTPVVWGISSVSQVSFGAESGNVKSITDDRITDDDYITYETFKTDRIPTVLNASGGTYRDLVLPPSHQNPGKSDLTISPGSFVQFPPTPCWSFKATAGHIFGPKVVIIDKDMPDEPFPHFARADNFGTERVPDPGAVCLDTIDGMFQAELISLEEVDKSRNFTATYQCTDSHGNSAIGVRNVGPADPPRSDEDWELNPTFGTAWSSNEPVVEDGFSFNGRVFDVTDNYHVDFERTTSVVGEPNTVSVKAYAEWPLETVKLSLGVPGISRVTDAEAEIVLDLAYSYGEHLEYEVTGIRHAQGADLVDPAFTTASASSVMCNSSTHAVCHEFTIRFRVQAPLSSDVLAISAMDTERRATTTYINDGVEFEGESLLEPETVELHFKRGNQHPVETVRLVQDDHRYNLWTDQDGYAWMRNSYGSWFQLTHAGFERFQDPKVNVMTRIHTDFETLVQHERERAALTFDAGAIASDGFEPDAPVPAEKVERHLLEKLHIGDLAKIQYLESAG
ncbi:MAG: hypothetical protein MPJ08_08140 [Nitrosopumilus sp.]|nr:hypothetical protein [Nitrosopumilus sp.]